jgi:F-type H+-transporting ATPase subunit alpha
MLNMLRSKHADILKDIATEKVLSDAIADRLKAALDEFKKTFAE